MPVYVYRCKEHGVFEVVQKYEDASWTHPCPTCGMQAKKSFGDVPVHYHTDGFFSTDHFKGDNRPGDKRERLNKDFERAGYGKPPPPDKSVPRNAVREM